MSEKLNQLLSGKRKFVFIGATVAGIMGVATLMVFYGKMPSSEWVDLAKWIGAGGAGAFSLGNGLEHIGKRNK